MNRTSLLKFCRLNGVLENAQLTAASYMGRASGSRDADRLYSYPCLVASAVELTMFGEGQLKHDHYHRWLSKQPPKEVSAHRDTHACLPGDDRVVTDKNYIPTSWRTCDEMAWKQQTQLVAEVSRDMLHLSRTSPAKIQAATDWWMVPGRMDAFDSAMRDMWKFD